MRHSLGTSSRLIVLGLVLVASGCGSATSTGGDAGAADPAEAPTAAASEVTLVSATAGGGDPATRATFVASDAALASYVGQFDDSFAGTVARAADALSVADGEVLLAQVVSIGCDKPLRASVRDGQDGVAMVPTPPPSPHRECIAPVTTVGLAAVPVSLEGGGR